MFLNNELPVFDGHYRKDIEDIDGLMRGIYLSVYINNLKTKRELLEWYLELNGGGTPHTKDELDKVREMLDQED